MTHPLYDKWDEAIKEDSYLHPEEFMTDNHYSLVTSEIVGTWRWGTIHTAIWVSDDTSELVGVDWQDGSGDVDIDADGMGVEFFHVREEEVTIKKYVRV